MAASVRRADAREGRAYVRLRRFGPRGAGGNGRYRFQKTGKVYKRDGIYPIDDPELLRLLLSTGNFEQIPERLLSVAKAEAKTTRGSSIEERSRRARQARARRRPHLLEDEAPTMEAPAAEADGDGLEL